MVSVSVGLSSLNIVLFVPIIAVCTILQFLFPCLQIRYILMFFLIFSFFLQHFSPVEDFSTGIVQGASYLVRAGGNGVENHH